MDSLSYWSDTSETGKNYSELPLPESVDCAIVGGGMTGISAAYYLANEGLKVALLERENLGWGASSRNGGMAIPGIKYKVSSLFKQHGVDATQRMFNASFNSVQLLKNLIAEKGIDCDLEETGSFAAAYRPSHYESLVNWQRTLADDFGHVTRIVPRAVFTTKPELVRRISSTPAFSCRPAPASSAQRTIPSTNFLGCTPMLDSSTRPPK